MREEGRYKDYYGGEYIKSAIWRFTTQSTGSDLAIMSVETSGELKPDEEAFFLVTVKNIGSETASQQCITASYIKDGIESEFRSAWGCVESEVPPGEERIVLVKVRFRDNLFEYNGIVYDNVLVSGQSQIDFRFYYVDSQDVGSANNNYVHSIEYEDAGGPVIDYFILREYGGMYDPTYDIFWARMGKELQVLVDAEDDVMIARGVVQFRLHQTEAWCDIYSCDNAASYLDFNYKWPVPTNIETTDDAQIRIVLYDDKGNETVRESDPFSIYSNRLGAEIQLESQTYEVGGELVYSVLTEGDYEIDMISVDLEYGAKSEDVVHFYDEDGLLVSNPYTWTIPDNNNYASQNCYLSVRVSDIRGNEVEAVSERFMIDPNTELPSPFNKSVQVYDEEYQFPSGASNSEDGYYIDFVRLDNDNLAHILLVHHTSYSTNTSETGEDDYYHSENVWYITYDSENEIVGPKILVCDKSYDVSDFAVIDGTPFVALESSDGLKRHFYTYLEGNTFVDPISVLNENIARIGGCVKKGELDYYGSVEQLGDPYMQIDMDGYLWELEVNESGTMNRFSFINGQIGERENFQLNSNEGEVYSRYVQPKADGGKIYFVDYRSSDLMVVDADSNTLISYPLPFDLEDNMYDGRNTILAVNGQVFLFGNGRVYKLESGTFKDKGPIGYSYDGEVVDYSDVWDEVDFSKAVVGDGKVYFFFNGFFADLTKPIWTDLEILEFDPQTCDFEKSVCKSYGELASEGAFAQGNASDSDIFDVEYAGNQKAIVLFGGSWTSGSIQHYGLFMQAVDLNTGDIYNLGQLPVDSAYEGNIVSDGGKTYAVVYNNRTGNAEAYEISIDSLSDRPTRTREMGFQKHNGSMYLYWTYGNLFDGRWDVASNNSVYSTARKNKAMKVYPTASNVISMGEEYLGSYAAVVGDYITFPFEAKVRLLHSDFTVGDTLLEKERASRLTYFDSFGADYLSCLCYDRSGTFDYLFVDENFGEDIFSIDNYFPVLATFENEIILLGEQEGSDRIMAIKMDMSSGDQREVRLDAFESYGDLEKNSAINENKFVAISYQNMIAVADFSKDIIAPSVSFVGVGGDVYNGDTSTLQWTANDNLDTIQRFELYKKDGTGENLLQTFEDPLLREFDYTFDEDSADELTFKIVAYDTDGNAGFDTIIFNVTMPVQIISFDVDTYSAWIGETLVFSWSAEPDLSDTIFEIYKRKLGSQEWDQYVSMTGRTTKSITLEGFFGDYEFEIRTENSSLALPSPVTVQGEIVEFDEAAFSPKDHFWYLGKCVVDFKWDIVHEMSNLVEYDLFVKSDNGDYAKVTSTPSMVKYHRMEFESVPNEVNWKVVAYHMGMETESSSYAFYPAELRPTEILSLELLKNDTESPKVRATFETIDGIDEYTIVRTDSAEALENFAASSSGVFDDPTVVYGETYEYKIVSKYGALHSEASESKILQVLVDPIISINILNENGSLLPSNSILLEYEPVPDNAYEHYEIRIGKDPDNLVLLEKTKSRSTFISDLDFSTVYHVEIHGLDHAGNRISQSPGAVVFTTPNAPVPGPPVNLSASGNVSGEISLGWEKGTGAQNGFRIERMGGIYPAFHEIAECEDSAYVDTGAKGNTSYTYRVLAYNGAGKSDYSNEASASIPNRAPAFVSVPPSTIHQDQTFQYLPLVHDPDQDPLSFFILQGPSEMLFNPLDGTMTWHTGNSDVGEHEISVKVSDGQLEDEQNFILTVIDVNDPPRITFSFPDYDHVALDAETSSYFRIDVEDPDDENSQLVKTWTLDDAVVGEDLFVSYRPNESDIGEHTLRVKVSDGTLFDERQWNIEVKQAGADVQIALTLEGVSSRPDTGWEIPVDIDFFTSDTSVLAYRFEDLQTAKDVDTSKVFLSGIAPGVYDITVVSEHTLKNIKRNVTITAPTTNVDMCALLEGDANNDGFILLDDFGLFKRHYKTQIGDENYNPDVDFDRDGFILLNDFGLFKSNYKTASPIECP